MNKISWMAGGGMLALLVFSACVEDSTTESLGLGTLDKADFVEGKSDAATTCRGPGYSPECDVCVEAGWYEDEVCDTFCGRPDPDCFEFDPLDAEQSIACIQNEYGSRLVVRVEGSDLIVTGHSDEGRYEDTCVWAEGGREVVCDFGFGEEVRIDLTLRREDRCDTLYEANDIIFYLEGTFDGGVLSSEKPLRCVLRRYERVNPC